MSRSRMDQHAGVITTPGAVMQRACACGKSASGLTGECEECARQKSLGLRAKLETGPAGDALEREADRVADAMVESATDMSHPGAVSPVKLSREASPDADAAAADTGLVGQALRGPSQALPPVERAYFEQGLGHDFSRVRVHTDALAAASARSVQAKAYTVGRDLVFGAGHYAPQHREGRRLLAHELTHVAQQSPDLRRAPEDLPAAASAPDPLCDDFDFERARREVVAQTAHFLSADDMLPLIRALKPIRRCASDAQKSIIRQALGIAISSTKADEAWQAAGTAFGGYTGFYPGYAPDVRTHLGKLGASESLPSATLKLSGKGAKHKSRAKAAAKRDVADLERTDIVYFRGHQFAQYKAPGLFSNGGETRGFDLRYVEKIGGFTNVKLLISTSCATLCKEAVEVFRSLFPNAVILGYRKSAPLEGGAVRSELTAKLNALNRPLLLDQPLDMSAIISTWQSIVETKHKGHTAPQPGYCEGGTVKYWDGAAWQTIGTADAANSCKVKGDFRGQYPEP